MIRKQQIALIKKLHLKKGANYIIFISHKSGLTGKDIQEIPYQIIGKNTQFVLVDGNVNNLIKVVEVNK